MTDPTTEIETLGKYRLEKRLGEGGMGVVWLATNPDLDIKVAIKTIKNRNPAYIQRFLQEARSATKINHFRVARILDAGSEGDQHYIVMEFLPGGDVGELLADGPLTPNFALYIIEAAAEGLAAAATVGIIHRDIKPDNIMLDSEGEPKLVDLGLAKELDGGSNLTATGAFMGTPAYIAPEQAAGKKDIDCRADIYSLGATLFHLVTGELPFNEQNPMVMALAHCTEPTPDPSERNSELPKPLCALIVKMMAKEPVDRYQTPVELIRAINSVTRNLGPPQQLRRGAPRRRFVANIAAKSEAATPLTNTTASDRPRTQKKIGLFAICGFAFIFFLWFFFRPEPPVSAQVGQEQSTDPLGSVAGGLQSTTFTLIDADADKPIRNFDPIPEGAVLDLATLPSRRLNIRANTATDIDVVQFSLNNQDEHSERTPPFALSGDVDGNYNAWTPPVGNYSLALVVGDQTIRLNFSVTDSTAPAWNATASHNNDDAHLAIDGNSDSRWTTHAMMGGDEWYQLDLGSSQSLYSIELETTQNPFDFPRNWEVGVSTEGKQWSTVKSGIGLGPLTIIELPPTKARFLRISQTGVEENRYWSIHELTVNGQSLNAKRH